MGYSGRVVLARGDRWAGDADVLSRTVFDGGWAAVTFDGDPRISLPGLVALTGAPVLSAFVMDSDCADVTAASPAGASWHTYLHEESALGYGAPELDQSVAEVVEAAAAWATEAGLKPDRGALATALGGAEVFVEDTLDSLFAALGLVGES